MLQPITFVEYYSDPAGADSRNRSVRKFVIHTGGHAMGQGAHRIVVDRGVTKRVNARRAMDQRIGDQVFETEPGTVFGPRIGIDYPVGGMLGSPDRDALDLTEARLRLVAEMKGGFDGCMQQAVVYRAS